jgi:hypothetical protein
MFYAILISLFFGVALGGFAFYFGHAYAMKHWNDLTAGLRNAKNSAEDELARLKKIL